MNLGLPSNAAGTPLLEGGRSTLGLALVGPDAI